MTGEALRVQAKDIPDDAFLDIVRAMQHAQGRWVSVWELADQLGVPEKVVRAKARRLIRRGEMEGCWCGCRGDFEVPE